MSTEIVRRSGVITTHPSSWTVTSTASPSCNPVRAFTAQHLVEDQGERIADPGDGPDHPDSLHDAFRFLAPPCSDGQHVQGRGGGVNGTKPEALVAGVRAAGQRQVAATSEDKVWPGKITREGPNVHCCGHARHAPS